MKNGGKNKSVAFIILFSVKTKIMLLKQKLNFDYPITVTLQLVPSYKYTYL